MSLLKNKVVSCKNKISSYRQVATDEYKEPNMEQRVRRLLSLPA